jgi:hypothetical protein
MTYQASEHDFPTVLSETGLIGIPIVNYADNSRRPQSVDDGRTYA